MGMNFLEVAKVGDIEDDEPLGIEVSGRHIALYRLDGEVFATDNVCPHQFALLSDGYMEDGCVECPLHQARFDIRTGAAQCGPVERGLKIFPVKVEGDSVFVDLGVQ